MIPFTELQLRIMRKALDTLRAQKRLRPDELTAFYDLDEFVELELEEFSPAVPDQEDPYAER